MKKEFKISIIVNCHNGEKYLSRCLKSIINQTFENWELIFFDNKSNDSSKLIYEKFKEIRFNYFSSSYFMKLYEARNEALQKVTGDYVAFLDCDDWWDPIHLENALPFFENDKFAFYFSNAFNYFKKKKKFILPKNNLPKNNIFEELINDYTVKISSVILRKKILVNSGLFKFDSNYNIIGDFDLILRIASKFEGFYNNIPSVNCSFHGNNYSLNNRNEYVDEFNIWHKKINFGNQKFLSKKKTIENNVLYINLFRDITTKKKINNFFQIFKIKNNLKKMKLLIIFMLPKFIIKQLLNKY